MSYGSLQPHVFFDGGYWGGTYISEAGMFGANRSRLYTGGFLGPDHYGVELDDEEFRRIVMWLDLWCQELGAYEDEEAQRRGERVWPAIDVDPASSAAANENVKAAAYYSKDDDGLTKRWSGRVWLNPPYGSAGPLFVAKLLEQYTTGAVQEAILLVNSNSTETQWFAPLWDHLLCFVSGRINFISNVGERSGSTHGSVFIYLGQNGERFKRVFSEFGPVVQRVA